MSAPTTEDLVEQIREVFAQAQAAGQPMPGRPTLAKLTGATDYRVRVALEQLTKSDPDAGVDTVLDEGVGDAPGEVGELDLANAASGDEAIASTPPGDHQPVTTTTPTGGELAAEQPTTATVVTSATAEVAEAAPAGGQHTTSTPATASVPVGAKIVSWTGFVFGSVMSVAANVLHTWLPAARMPPGWSPDIASQIGAAVWPLGLLLSVEVLSRVPWPRGWQWLLARFAGTGMVALGSAVISYGHVQEVLVAWGYGELASYVGPLVLDGLMVISGFALLAMSSSPQASTSTGPGGR